MYDLMTGPILWASIILFLTGSVIKIFRAYKLLDGTAFPVNREILRVSGRHIRAGIPGRNFFFTLATVSFHVILLVSPLLQLAHQLILSRHLNISFAAVPEGLSDVLAFIACGCGLILLLRRIVYSEVRAISSAYDYILLVITILPFVLGILAYRQMGDYSTILSLHMVSGEIILILLGWTKLGHMYHFILARLFISSEYNSRRGGWQY